MMLWMHRCLAVVTLMAFSGAASARDVVIMSTSRPCNNMVLDRNKYYFVVSDVVMEAEIRNAALKVLPGETAVIYIAKGKTLTINGGGAWGPNAGWPAIEVPKGAKLIITGEGTLRATGGGAGNGGEGGNGGDGYLSRDGDGWGYGGQGGSGGYGGGGAAAAIGGAGGNGHLAQNGPTSSGHTCFYSTFDHDGNNGYSSINGDPGHDMGIVYIAGTVNVQAIPGGGNTSVLEPGRWGSNVNDRGSGWFWDYDSGSGGPGGGGGSGYPAIYGIGGGAPGAQCGGTGGSGGTHVGRSYKYKVGRAGYGGNGYVVGQTRTDGAPEVYSWTSNGGSRNNSCASHGNHGVLQTDAEGRVYGQRTAAKVDYPKEIEFKLQFFTQGGEGEQPELITHLGLPLPNKVLEPKRRGYFFLGYFTEPEGGEKIYDNRGETTRCCEFNGHTKLYAHWTDALAYNVTQKIAYTTSVRDAIKQAHTGDVIRLMVDQDEVVIDKAITFDLDGCQVKRLFVKDINDGNLYINNGKVGELMGDDSHNMLYAGDIEINNVKVWSLSADGHNVTLLKGTVTHLLNMSNTFTADKMGMVTIRGDHSFVEGINDDATIKHKGYVFVTGGWFPRKDIGGEQSGIIIPANYELVAMEAPQEDAPTIDFVFKAEIRKNFKNYTNFNGAFLNTKMQTNQNVVIKMHFSINSLNAGWNAICGSADGTPDNSKNGFALMVDSKSRRFAFAVGGAFEFTPDGLAETGKDYYLTMSKGSFRLDTVPNATHDFYHRDVAIYRPQFSTQPMSLGCIFDKGRASLASNITVYDYQRLENDIVTSHIVPAYGNTKQPSILDFAMYDLVKKQCVYAGEGSEQFFETMVGQCAEHPAYRITGTGNGAKRECVVCSMTSEPEKFIEGNLAELMQTEDGYIYHLHYALNEGDRTERDEELTYQQLPDLNKVKLFSMEMLKDGAVRHRYIPYASCGKFIVHDEITNEYRTLSTNDITGNFDLKTEHYMVDVEQDDKTMLRTCSVCGATNNSINMMAQMALITDYKPNKNTEIDLLFKVNGDALHDEWVAEFNATAGTRQVVLYENGKSMEIVYENGRADIEKNKLYHLNIKYGNTPSLIKKLNTLYVTVPFQEGGAFGIGCSQASKTSTARLPHISFFGLTAKESGILVADYRPSIYDNKVNIYNTVSGNHINANYSLVPQIEHCFLQDCPHEYLGTEVYVDDNVEYRTCQICGLKRENNENQNVPSGMQYVDTEYHPNNKTRVRMTFQPTHEVATGSLFGTQLFGLNLENGRLNWDERNYVKECRPNGVYTIERDINGVYDYATSKAVLGKTMETASHECDWTSDAITQTQGCGAFEDLRSNNKYLHFQMKIDRTVFASPGLISAIAFHCSKRDYGNFAPDTEIYLGQTNNSGFSPLNNGELTKVFQGSPLFQEGWNTLQLTTPFLYDNSKDLVVYVKTKGTTSGAMYFDVFGGGTRTFSKYTNYYSDLSDWNNATINYYHNVTRIVIQELSSPLNPDSDKDATHTITIGANREKSSEASGSKVYGFNILENGELLREFVPAQKDSMAGMFETMNQKFHPLQGEGDLKVKKFQPCEEHTFWDIYKTVNDYGVETWTRRCRVCDYKENIIDAEPYAITNYRDYFSGVSGNPGDRITDYTIYNTSGEILHRYLPSLWEGKVQLYDVATDKFHCCVHGHAQAYVPTCKSHRYFVMEESGTGYDKKVVRHCKLCDARIELNGLQVDSLQQLRSYVYREDPRYTMYIDMLRKGGDVVTETCQTYPMISKEDMVFAIDVMHEGKLMEQYLPAQRHQADTLAFGVFSVLNERFITIPGSTVFFSGCTHPYFALQYKDGVISKHCHICDETMEAVGYYMDLTYNANRADGKEKTTTQRITMLLDGTDTSDKTLHPNQFRNGLYFFGGWRESKTSGSTLTPGEEYLPSAQRKGEKQLYAKWEDGFTFNGDTLQIEKEGVTPGIHIEDDGCHPFGATKSFDGQNVSYSREIPRDMVWGTLCLPFKPESPFYGINIYDVTSVSTDAKGNIVVNMALLSDNKSMEAGTPYIFEITDRSLALERSLAGDRLVIDNKNATTFFEAKPKTQKLDGLDFVGSYTYETFTCEDADTTYFALSGNKFLKTKRQMTVSPYRAHLQALLNSPASVREVVYLTIDGETTPVNMTREDKVEGSYEYFTLDGKRIVEPTAHGVYIRRGQSGKSVKVMKK